MNDVEKAERRLNEARQGLERMRAEFDQAAEALDSLDVTEGNIDDAVEQKIKLTTKRDILAQRLEIAKEALQVHEGDLKIETARGLREQVTALGAKLESACAAARKKLLNQIHPSIFDTAVGDRLATLADESALNRLVQASLDVVPLGQELQMLESRCRAAEALAAPIRGQRERDEAEVRHRMEEEIVDGRV